ncbi:hypothetical protein [Haloarcula halophila]|uniref:hypothetical protein n=1 Tax=Haloarcula TaxID=2237 RepID=UPI0023E38E02|nr:hypothetical protein [Halomicroarcula sp. DFY41]
MSPSGNFCLECGSTLSSADKPLSEALSHYLSEHPKSETLGSVLENVRVEVSCENCGKHFPTDLQVSYVDGEGRLTAQQYCPQCEDSDPLRRIFVQDIDPSEALENQVCHEANSYQLDGGHVSPEWRDVYLGCPDCEMATTVDLPRGNCNHCGTCITVTVHSNGVQGSDLTEGNEVKQ